MDQQQFNFQFDLPTALTTLANNEKRFALTYLKSPDTFIDEIGEDKNLTHLTLSTGLTYRGHKAISLVGGLSLFLGPTFAPPPRVNDFMRFHVASANGAFHIYENSKAEHFLKVALTNSDYMEVEAVALLMIRAYVPKQLQRYFLEYRAATNLLIYKDPSTNAITLDINRYRSTEHTSSFFGNATINHPSTLIAPALITNVVPGGLSLSQIVHAWSHIVPSSDPKKLDNLQKSMRLFHKSAIYDRAINATVLETRVMNAARSHIFTKFDEFIAAILTSTAPLKMSHGDLHMANVMYDCFQENFVMIDYGRISLDLEHLSVPIATLKAEIQKVQSMPEDDVLPEITTPNKFFETFRNFGARHYFDNDKVTQYAMLADLAPLTFFVYQRLFMRLQLERNPIVSLHPFTDTIFIASPEETRAYLEANAATLTPTQLMLVFFALMLQAMKKQGLINNITFSVTGGAPGNFAIDIDELFASRDPDAPFFSSGQPKPKFYAAYKTQLEAHATSLRYFDILEAALSKKLTQGLTGGSMSQVIKSNNTSKMSKELTQLTIANYEDNMRAAAEMSVLASQQCDKPPRQSQQIQPVFKLTKSRSTDDSRTRTKPSALEKLSR